jgi:hypothetical protein
MLVQISNFRRLVDDFLEYGRWGYPHQGDMTHPSYDWSDALGGRLAEENRTQVTSTCACFGRFQIRVSSSPTADREHQENHEEREKKTTKTTKTTKTREREYERHKWKKERRPER